MFCIDVIRYRLRESSELRQDLVDAASLFQHNVGLYIPYYGPG